MWTRPRLVSLATPLIIILAAPALGQEPPVTVCAVGAWAGALADLEADHPGLELLAVTGADDLREKAPRCKAIVGLYGGLASPEVFATPELRWVQVASAGVERFVGISTLAQSGIVLTNAKIIQGPEIADHAFALLLNLTRDLKLYNELMTRGFDRQTHRLPIIELRGKTALVIGLGGIGTQIAQRAAAFGMRVLGVDPKDIPLHRDVEYVGKPDELDALLPEADVVFSSVPLTDESRRMLGARQFELMKDGVYLINVSRGGVVDTDALVAALRSGKVRAAGLDVTDPEPLPSGHPLWSMPNVTITPHVATLSDQLDERRLDLFRDNVVRFVEGRPLRNVVDKAKGY